MLWQHFRVFAAMKHSKYVQSGWGIQVVIGPVLSRLLFTFSLVLVEKYSVETGLSVRVDQR